MGVGTPLANGRIEIGVVEDFLEVVLLDHLVSEDEGLEIAD